MPEAAAAEVDDLTLFPWRICLAGGWLDQPWVSSLHPGLVIVVNVEPHPVFKTRSGLATSTRTLGIELWGARSGGAPPRDVPPERLARLLFNVENPVGCAYVSGSQDALGLMLPGVSRLDYDGSHWPSRICALEDEESVAWLQRVLRLVPLPARPPGYDPLIRQNLSAENVRGLAAASEQAWAAIEARDAARLGRALSRTMAAWRELLPETVPAGSDALVAPYAHHHGCLFSGAGGGFLLVIADEAERVQHGFRVEITRRRSDSRAGAAERAPASDAQPPGGCASADAARQSSHVALSDNLGRLLALLCVCLQLAVLASSSRLFGGGIR